MLRWKKTYPTTHEKLYDVVAEDDVEFCDQNVLTFYNSIYFSAVTSYFLSNHVLRTVW